MSSVDPTHRSFIRYLPSSYWMSGMSVLQNASILTQSLRSQITLDQPNHLAIGYMDFPVNQTLHALEDSLQNLCISIFLTPFHLEYKLNQNRSFGTEHTELEQKRSSYQNRKECNHTQLYASENLSSYSRVEKVSQLITTKMSCTFRHNTEVQTQTIGIRCNNA